MITANVQSLSPKIDGLIAFIQVENFDVIWFYKIWLDTQNKHLLAEVAINGYEVFLVDKPTQQEWEVDQLCMSNALWKDPMVRKSSPTCKMEIIQVYINLKNAVDLKLELIYRNARSAAADDD